MPVLPPSSGGPVPAGLPNGTCSFKGIDIVQQAMVEMGAIDPNETPTGPEANTVLTKLNRLLDAWNADGKYIYAYQFLVAPLLTNTQPQTIGPTGNWMGVNQRPEKILNANVLLNYPGNTSIRQKVNIRDADWWANKSAYAVVATFPTDLYYEPDWNNGSLYLWPIPTVAYPLEIEVYTVLQQLQLTSVFCMPPGYMDAVVYSLAVSICPSFGKEVSPTLARLALLAERRIQAGNISSPRISTRDAGMANGESNRATWSYLTGQSVTRDST